MKSNIIQKYQSYQHAPVGKNVSHEAHKYYGTSKLELTRFHSKVGQYNYHSHIEIYYFLTLNLNYFDHFLAAFTNSYNKPKFTEGFLWQMYT